MRLVLTLVGIYVLLMVVGVLLYRQQRAASLVAAPAVGLARVAAPSVTAAPEAPPAPVSSVVVAPEAIPGYPLAVTPSAPLIEPVPLPAEAPVAPGLPQGWSETPSSQETPMIEVKNTLVDGEPTIVVFRDGRREFRMDCTQERALIEMPAGDYRYELQSTRFNRRGIPDQIGGFRCRKYRIYRLTISSGAGRPDVPVDVGDQ